MTRRQPEELRILHASDVHATRLVGVPLGRFFGPRFRPALSRALGRTSTNDVLLLDAVFQLSGSINVDHVVVTGDLTQFALEQEFILVGSKLRRFHVPVTIVPGNHDIFTANAAREDRFERHLGDFISGERFYGEWYPFVSYTKGNVAIVGVSSACKDLAGKSLGTVGRKQLERLHFTLVALGRRGFRRLVLLHHPPALERCSKSDDCLLDSGALMKTLRLTGVEIVLHGHLHRPRHLFLHFENRRVPLLGAGSCTGRGRSGASFSVYSIQRNRLTVIVYRWAQGRFSPDEPTILELTSE